MKNKVGNQKLNYQLNKNYSSCANKLTGGIKKCLRVQDDRTSVDNFGFLTVKVIRLLVSNMQF